MKTCIIPDEWNIVEDSFHPEENMIYESIMSLGNGYMGMRGNFEEDFSGNTLSGMYIAGVYYPDKTRVGWWKNGYPEYFAKVLNATNVMGLHLKIDNELIDLSKLEIQKFNRSLNMQDGNLYRTVVFKTSYGKLFEISAQRFFSIKEKEIGVLKYSIKSLSEDADIEIRPYLNGDIRNQDSNYDEMFWNLISASAKENFNQVTLETKKTKFAVSNAAYYDFDNSNWIKSSTSSSDGLCAENSYRGFISAHSSITLYKYIAVTTNRDNDFELIESLSKSLALNALNKGFDSIYQENKEAWNTHWNDSDIQIKGDISAQQAIRFNIFQLNQTYTGDDPRLNIGPKGFTGEKYGGSTYWDTEAYCLYFYLSTSSSEIARNLLIYRYNHLQKAKENAAKLGLKGALYPMVTMNGEECHNEWEITFEEIHRNAAISYAILNYIRYTGDTEYLYNYGLEVLIEISRFWESRVNYNSFKDVYMILGVTGPNEYDNNVNNNWYTNRMAQWNLNYTIECIDFVKKHNLDIYHSLSTKLNLSESEVNKWSDIANKMYLPIIKDLDIFEQQDGYMDKEQILVKDLDISNLPLNQNWSWDRILRSPFIKQADVLQGLFFLYDAYDVDTKKKNFDFYEPRTVHESSLSPCVFSILAGEIGYTEQAYDFYLRTARLDLDNYNNDTDDGLHITSMAGTWMSIVYGFGGMRISNDMLNFKPFIPKAWDMYSFKILFRERHIDITVTQGKCSIKLMSGGTLDISIFDNIYTLTDTLEILF